MLLSHPVRDPGPCREGIPSRSESPSNVAAIAFGAVCVLSIGWPVFITFATDVAGPSRATAIGMMGGSNRLGAFIGSAMGGAFLAVGGYGAVGIFCLVAVAFSVSVMVLFMREPGGSPL